MIIIITILIRTPCRAREFEFRGPELDMSLRGCFRSAQAKAYDDRA